MRKVFICFVVPLFVMSSLVFVPSSGVPASEKSGSVIQSQEMNYPGVVAEIIECKQKKGVLTLKVRIKNTSSEKVRVLWRDAKKNVYLLDETNQKKYFILKDANGEYIYSGDPWDIQPNSSKISWFKFPAPTPDLDEITVVLNNCAPFEDVPITKKKKQKK